MCYSKQAKIRSCYSRNTVDKYLNSSTGIINSRNKRSNEPKRNSIAATMKKLRSNYQCSAPSACYRGYHNV